MADNRIGTEAVVRDLTNRGGPVETDPMLVLIDFTARRRFLVARMAADLIKYDAASDERDAIRSLFGRGYAMPDIVMLIDDARQLAVQEIVAKEMAKP